MIDNASFSWYEPWEIYSIKQAPYPYRNKYELSYDAIAIIITIILSVLLVAIMYFYYKHKWLNSPLKLSIKRTRYRRIIIYITVSISLYINKSIYNNPL